MTDLFTPVLIVHITLGLAATALGLPPVLTRKGSRTHRLFGRIYAWTMGLMLACAWLMTAIHFSSYFLAMSATATMALFSGVRVLRRKRPDLDPGQRAKLLDWILTSGVVAVGVWVLTIVATGGAGPTAPVAAALAYGALVYGGWDLWRFARPTDWPFSPELWRYEHLVKMIGAWGAVVAAFSGNFLTFLPAPWSQLWPSLTFQTISMFWVAVLIIQRRRRAAA